jgi:regulator of replication initiation timing
MTDIIENISIHIHNFVSNLPIQIENIEILIKNYKNLLTENDKLKNENKSLKEKIQTYENIPHIKCEII